MNGRYVVGFYVKGLDGVMVSLGRVECDRRWLVDSRLREVVGRGMGLGGWNYVGIGKFRFYAEEGPGYGVNEIRSVRDVGGKLEVELVDGVRGGELPMRPGYEVEVVGFKGV